MWARLWQRSSLDAPTPTHIRRGGSACKFEGCDVTYNEGVVIFFTDSKCLLKVKVAPTRGLPSGVGKFLHWLIGTMASLQGLFCAFVLLGDPA